jgi:selenide,water dikinase
VLRHVVPFADPAVLVDASTVDDAAVYRISSDRALVATVDFFTPLVDDPYDFGRIAAANALSDLYAMGARPLFALNIVAFPRDRLDENMFGENLLGEILRGGSEVARDAGIAVVGGHSVDDPEPKYGMCAIGEVHPDRIIRNSSAQPGDALVLTKPIGTGIIATAIKKEAAPPDAIRAAVDSMTTLNRAASDAMREVGVHAATDVTGFGLLGHLRNMLRASGVGARIHASAIPLLPHALELAKAGFVPGGTRRNLADIEVQWDASLSEARRLVISDAQTSGGLLIALPKENVGKLLGLLSRHSPMPAAAIGEILEVADSIVIER